MQETPQATKTIFMNYRNILELLQKSYVDFSSECLAAISYEAVIMFSGELAVNDELIQTYIHRQEIQDFQRTKMVLGYDALITQLHLLPVNSTVNFTSLYTLKNCYIIYYNENKVLCILKSFSSNIKKQITLFRCETVSKENYSFFMKGKKLDIKEFYFLLDKF